MPLRPVEIGEVDERRDEIRVETQCRAIFGLGLGQFPAPQIEQSEIEMRLRPVGIDHLGGDELRSGLDQGRLLRSGVNAKRSVPASTRAASMRTVRTGSLSRGAIARTTASRAEAGRARGAASLTSGSASAIAAFIAGSEAEEA